ncbi:SMUG2 DNA glycosylase family protein [Listeria monocytogenes]|uniref:SMUG2 DNA glycosylase family protein n=1 Tax=Listeria monocytogenes TaxID=1639 RepID=UPI0010D4A623|nr:SMUG2 DNA glycosylase family protein [Listeria monocytogenes]EAE0010352.1 SMUG2 DNA glycosylase family protein [Listeria monocytogenes]EME1036804.1 SMUG2 DNA glycosylase family protein [Listeria monocytogenes]
MTENTTIAKQILQFNEVLRNSSFDLPEGYRAVNPYSGDQSELVEKITTAFYQKYYNDTKPRRIILGSSPARRGSAVTGVPFEDAKHLQNETGIFIDEFYINQSSSDFLYDVMTEYGSCEQFYTDFYMNFVCPLGIVRTNAKGNEVNCNYYENKKLQTALKSFILESIRRQIDFGIDTSVCYCIGSGENFHFLSKINDEHHFFGTIIPLEHPRFIMQYNSKNKDVYMKKYLCALKS